MPISFLAGGWLGAWRPAQASAETMTAAATPSRVRKILVLSVSAGAGHVRAAEAIAAYADAHEAGLEVMHLDAMDFVPSFYRRLYTDGYIRLVSRYPALWRGHYHVTNTNARDRMPHKIRRGADRISARSMLNIIRELQPDAIICTHFLPAEILAHAPTSGRPRIPVWVQVTDFDLHRFWIHPGMAGYFAASQEVAFRMMAEGIAASNIHVTGIPIMPAFARHFDRQACLRKLGLDAKRKPALLMGGSAGGVTISECMAMELPMILHGPIPGQEERNADYLAEEGVALKACDAVTLEYRVRYLIAHPKKQTNMRRLARQRGRPLAARHVLDAVTGRKAA